MVKFNLFNKIPAQYRSELLAQQTHLMQMRINILCFFAIGINFFISVIYFLTLPAEKDQVEPWIAAIVFAACIVTLLTNRVTRSRWAIRLNVYFFTAVLLLIATHTGLLHADYAQLMPAVYLLILFFLTFSIPWLPVEIVPIALLVMAAYTIYYLVIRRLWPSSPFTFEYYFEGFLLIYIGSVVAVFMRARDIVQVIKNIVFYKKIESQKEIMQHELEVATHVHRTLIPPSLSAKNIDISVTCLPAHYLGGDYARYTFVSPDQLLFIIGDVTGHGVPAALLVNRIHTEFEELARSHTSPGKLLTALNNFIIRDFEGTNMYLSAFCGLIDMKKHELTFTNCGHPAQYLYVKNGSRIRLLTSQDALLGVMPTEGHGETQVPLGDNDRIVLFTDGAIEAKNAAAEEFGQERVENYILAQHGLEPERFNAGFIKELTEFAPDGFNDDVFLMTIQMK